MTTSLSSKNEKIIIQANDYHSPIVEKLSTNATVLSIEKVHQNPQLLKKAKKICGTHEEAVEAIYRYAPESVYGQAIHLFRNKTKLREAICSIYPEFYFKQIKLFELPKQKLDFNTKKYIIKPVKGFFGIAVHIIDQFTDLQRLQNKIKAEIKKQANLHPEYIKTDALSSEDFLIEEYVGTTIEKIDFLDNIEIAVDGYYNETGEFVLISLYHHPYKNNHEYFHMLYYLSQRLYELFSEKIIYFFNKLRETLNLDICSFPLHAEFKYYKTLLFPIEINPGRFAGLGLSDLIYYAFKVNPYELFLNDKPFDWRTCWHKKQVPPYYAWILAYRGIYSQDSQAVFDHQKFKNLFKGKLLYYDPITYDPSVCSIAFTRQFTNQDLLDILDINLDDYLIPAEEPPIYTACLSPARQIKTSLSVSY